MPVTLPTCEDQMRHISRKAEGHVVDTPEHRDLFLGVAYDEQARLESDQYGNDWSVKALADSRQAWVQVREQQIVNAESTTLHAATTDVQG